MAIGLSWHLMTSSAIDSPATIRGYNETGYSLLHAVSRLVVCCSTISDGLASRVRHFSWTSCGLSATTLSCCDFDDVSACTAPIQRSIWFNACCNRGLLLP